MQWFRNFFIYNTTTITYQCIAIVLQWKFNMAKCLDNSIELATSSTLLLVKNSFPYCIKRNLNTNEYVGILVILLWYDMIYHISVGIGKMKNGHLKILIPKSKSINHFPFTLSQYEYWKKFTNISTCSTFLSLYVCFRQNCILIFRQKNVSTK